MIDKETLATLCGFAGVLSNVVWPMMTTRERLLTGQIVACCFMLTHFALLGASTGALVMATAGLQAALALPLGKSSSFKNVYLASLVLTPVVCYMSWHGMPSVFSSLALATVCIANYQQNVVVQRSLLILAIFAWIAHNVLIASVPALTSNVLTLCMSCYMLYRTVQNSKPITSAA